MSEQLLDHTEVGAPIEQMGGVAVPEGMGVCRHRRAPVDDAPHVPRSQAVAPSVEEHGLERRSRGTQDRPTRLDPRTEDRGTPIVHRRPAAPWNPCPGRGRSARRGRGPPRRGRRVPTPAGRRRTAAPAPPRPSPRALAGGVRQARHPPGSGRSPRRPPSRLPASDPPRHPSLRSAPGDLGGSAPGAAGPGPRARPDAWRDPRRRVPAGGTRRNRTAVRPPCGPGWTARSGGSPGKRGTGAAGRGRRRPGRRTPTGRPTRRRPPGPPDRHAPWSRDARRATAQNPRAPRGLPTPYLDPTPPHQVRRASVDALLHGGVAEPSPGPTRGNVTKALATADPSPVEGDSTVTGARDQGVGGAPRRMTRRRRRRRGGTVIESSRLWATGLPRRGCRRRRRAGGRDGLLGARRWSRGRRHQRPGPQRDQHRQAPLRRPAGVWDRRRGAGLPPHDRPLRRGRRHVPRAPSSTRWRSSRPTAATRRTWRSRSRPTASTRRGR